jgi:hypothetical protein
VGRAGLHEGGRRRGVGSGGGAVGGGRRCPPDRLGLRGHRFGEGAHDLAERAADRVGGIARIVVAVEHSHHQAKGLGRGEDQRRQSQTTADAVAAVGPTGGLDRDAGVAKDADVAPGGPLGDAELVGEPVRGDARAALDQFEGQECPCRGARVRHHHNPVPDPDQTQSG